VLKEKLLIEANKIVLIDSPVFSQNFSRELIQKTVPLIQEYKATPEEQILYRNDNDECAIYFIEKGCVEIYLKPSLENESNKY
jgi:CRP-like cAMP-binding protein